MRGIEKRQQRRINFKLNAEVTYNSKRAHGVVKNFSETGMCKVIFSEKGVINFYPGEMIVICITIPSGQEVQLECEIKWVRVQKGSPLFLKYSVGAKILNPPPAYTEFIQVLLRESVAVA